MERHFLTVREAMDLLSIHVTTNPNPGFIFGADWALDTVANLLKNADKIEIGGKTCRAKGHGLVAWVGVTPHFIQCDDTLLQGLIDDRETEAVK